MTSAQKVAGTVVFVLAASLLAACSPEGEPGPSASPSEEASPSASSTPEPSRPPLTGLVLTTEGLGTLLLGNSVPNSDPAIDMVSFHADACTAEGLPGIYTANYPDIDEGIGPRAPFAVNTVDGTEATTLNRIDVNTTQIATDTGITLGSSLDAVLGVYPGGPDVVVNHADVSDVYVIQGTRGQLQFEVAVDRIPDYWDPSAINTVVFLSAIAIEVPPYGVAASGNVIGVCNIG